jgi:hypothetical protein
VPEPRVDTPAYRIIEIVGSVLLVVGLIGVLLVPTAPDPWVVMIGFGAPSAVRAVREWRTRRGPR